MMFPRTFHKKRREFGNPIEYVKQNPHFIPPPATNLTNLNLPLDIVLPNVDPEIEQAGKLVFHCVGDTGGINDGSVVQTAIAERMEAQIQNAAEPDKPRFFYHLGDIVYFNGQSHEYPQQFYEPYQHYPAPIFAIPGNHDGDTHVRSGDAPVVEPTLTGFMNNFCDSQARFLFPYRETMTQPYAFWALEAPFVTIVGLYSNVDGLLDGRGTNEQQRWLEDQLRSAPTDRCLLIMVHHPPFSLDQTHGGYPDIGLALDRAIRVTNRLPDAVFSGHVHSYQRFARALKSGQEIPYIVAGSGGYAHSNRALHKLQRDSNKQPIKTPFNTLLHGLSLQSYNEHEPGFLRLTATSDTLTGEFFTVPFDGEPPDKPFDRFTLNWKEHRIH
jgi:3',5'-cyclic AMP phosphodiesterase CpdA